MRHAYGEKMRIVLEMARGPEGLTNASYCERFGTSSVDAAGYINTCRRLFRAKRKNMRIHWFDTAERAAAWAALPGNPTWAEKRNAGFAKNKARRAAEIAARKVVTLKAPSIPAAKFTAGPSKVKAPITGEVDYSRARVISCPSPQFIARWQCRLEAPDERWPSFSARPIGIYDEVTA